MSESQMTSDAFNERTKKAVIITSNEIAIPMEWSMGMGFVSSYVQITLVDDRIVIHKPLDMVVQYTKPCKAGEDGYIRKYGLLGVNVPKQLLTNLNIKDGDAIDLTLEENCISFRKTTVVEPPTAENKPADPIMAFCCVCGKLLYTDGLVKLAPKYICRDCIEIIKSL